jgi:hypothetical protein
MAVAELRLLAAHQQENDILHARIVRRGGCDRTGDPCARRCQAVLIHHGSLGCSSASGCLSGETPQPIETGRISDGCLHRAGIARLASAVTISVRETLVSDSEHQVTERRGARAAQLWMRAHHEAAHAVVGTLFGGRVTGVEVWGGPPVGGRTELSGLDTGSAEADGSPFRPDGHSTVRRIVYLLAGPVGARISGGGSALIMNDPAAYVSIALGAVIDNPDAAELPPELADVRAVAGLVLEHFGPEDEAGIAAAVDHLGLSVESLVRDHWSGIQTVAASLLRHGRLTEDGFHSLWTLAMPAPAGTDPAQNPPMLPDSLSEV